MPFIEVEALSKSFGSGSARRHVLDRVRLSVERGEFVSIVGATGSGKSTLLSMLAGLTLPDEGRVTIGGDPVRGFRRDAAFVFQNYSLLPWFTALENVRLAVEAARPDLSREEQRAQAQRTLEQVGLGDALNRRPRQLSGGMRQRVAIARAFATSPDVLFLDEPFTGTDPVARRELMDIIRRLGAEGKSVLVSSHVLHEVQTLTPNIILLNRGRLVAEGHVRQIRDLIDKHPHHIVLVCDEYRRLAARLLAWEDVEGVRVQARDRAVVVETHAPDAFYGRLPELALEDGLAIREVYSDDDNLDAVFKYLVSK
jgi:ABC-2 type transport system ATP-binding protein